MNKKILLIPIDDRPCTFAMPKKMAAVAGFESVTPPDELLGRYLEPGKPEKIFEWLEGSDETFDFSIIAIDMLLYGGLVASRKSDTSFEAVKKRLERFETFVHKNRERLGKVYVLNTLMRTAPTYTDESMVPHVGKVVEYSQKYYEVNKSGSGQDELERLKRTIPPEMLKDYIEARERSHSIDLLILDLIEKGIADFILMGIDDSKTTGINVLEKEELECAASNKNLCDSFIVVPGTDEGLCLLLARALNETLDRWPSVCPVYSSPETAVVVPIYEDRSIGEIVKVHLRAARCKLSENPEDADLLFFVYGPSKVQKEAAGQRIDIFRGDSSSAFIEALLQMINAGRPTAMADVYYANGADDALMKKFVQRVNPFDLYGYAAWNTAGNSIGTALSHGLIRLAFEDEDEAHLTLLMERIIDDWIYQADVRQIFSAEARIRGISVFHLDEHYESFRSRVKGKIEERIRGLCDGCLRNFLYVNKKGEKYVLDGFDEIKTDLPWGRLFEVSLDFKLSLIRG